MLLSDTQIPALAVPGDGIAVSMQNMPGSSWSMCSAIPWLPYSWFWLPKTFDEQVKWVIMWVFCRC